jgi:hypothetical protein
VAAQVGSAAQTHAAKAWCAGIDAAVELSDFPERAAPNKAKKSMLLYILLAVVNTGAFLYFCHRVYKLDGAIWASIVFFPSAPILYSIIKNGSDQNGMDALAFAAAMVICIAYYNNYKRKKANQETDEK